VGSFEGGNGVVVMTNTNNEPLFDEIINSVATVYNWKDYYKPEIRDLKYGLVFLALGSLSLLIGLTRKKPSHEVATI
jgi:hypothetical protein